MPKTARTYRLSDEAMAAIEVISKETGLSATAIVEMTVREAAKRYAVFAMSPEAQATRSLKKAATSVRKAELRKQVAAAVKNPAARVVKFKRDQLGPARIAGEPISRPKICRIHTPKWCAPNCKYRT